MEQYHPIRCALLLVMVQCVFSKVNGNSARRLTSFATVLQSTTLVTPGELKWTADKVLDGCITKTCIARTQAHGDNWLRIDLGNVYKISSITIYTASSQTCDTCPDTGLDECILELSVTKGFPQCIRFNVTASDGENVTISTDNNGRRLPDSRYVTLRRKYHQLTLAEVEVFGECQDNYCGLNCTDFCFCRRPLRGDQKVIGAKCTGGCLDGWQGERCHQRKCAHGKFGIDCSHTCRCFSKQCYTSGLCYSQCDPFTGECIGPDRRCHSGYYGPSCQKLNLEPVWTRPAANAYMTDEKIETCGMMVPAGLVELKDQRSISHVAVYLKADPSDSLQSKQLQMRSKNGSFSQVAVYNHTQVGCGQLQLLHFLCRHKDITAFSLAGLMTEMQICEIELYKCTHGFYGVDCNLPCHCFQAGCKNTDGTCLGNGKCKKGWSGTACNQKCPNGKYGQDCKQTCNCPPERVCHHVSGQCLDCYSDECQNITVNTEDYNSKPIYRPDNNDGNFDDGLDSPEVNRSCTDCKVENKDPDSSDNIMTAYSVLGAALVLLVIMATLTISYSLKQKRTERLLMSLGAALILLVIMATLTISYSLKQKRLKRRSRLLNDLSHTRGVELDIQMEKVVKRHPEYDHLAATCKSMEVEVEIEKIQVDMEADVLDDAVLDLYDDDFLPETDPSGPLPIHKLWSHIQKLKSEEILLLKEFASLPIGICDSVDDAVTRANKLKNRYNGVYPYNFNRVKLNRCGKNSVYDTIYDSCPSDFINASYFDGFQKEKAYIVTQGPLEWTKGDFWEMIWQENTSQIVMLTNLVEERKVKCCRYWPSEGQIQCGKINIELISSTKLPDFTINELRIKMLEGTASRIVCHYHYESWPDKQVPESAWNLVDFWRHVRSSRVMTDGPMVVHCSAGVGRSGTFIGLDYLYDEATSKGSVQVFDCVLSMRKQRINMVQTKFQYMYLHEILAEALYCGSLPVDLQIFPRYIEDLYQTDSSTGKSHMGIQYENLCEGIAKSLSEDDEEIYANNRSGQAQALYLKDHLGNHSYLIVQSSYLAEDEEFWTNVYSTKAKTIVTFENFGTEMSVLENESPVQVGEIELFDFHAQVEGTFTRWTLSLRMQDEEPWEVSIFECTLWNNGFGLHEILNFVDDVSACQQNDTKSEIIIFHYGDDPSRIGPFLTVYDELDRMYRTNRIGLFETIWKFKSVLPNIIPDFCHIRKAKGIDNLYEHVNGSYFQYQKDKGFPKGVCLLEWLILSIAEIQRERTI